MAKCSFLISIEKLVKFWYKFDDIEKNRFATISIYIWRCDIFIYEIKKNNQIANAIFFKMIVNSFCCCTCKKYVEFFCMNGPII